MTQSALAEPAEVHGRVQAKPYHHGDLQRALIEAADRILERDGPRALSLRAVAREAGVSPAAPYHLFKDKDELVNAVAGRGFQLLAEAMAVATKDKLTDKEQSIAQGVAYVCFARDHAALYHIMFDGSRKHDPNTQKPREQSTAYTLARDLRARQGEKVHAEPLDVELATIASWCAAHGLAEMAHYKAFDDLKKQLGGDEAFFAAVLDHLGMFRD